MRIYSIKEIVKATNNFLEAEPENLFEKNLKLKKTKLSPETESIIIEAEKSILEKKNFFQNKEKPLLLKNEAISSDNKKINSFNYKIKIKPEIKDYMINELYQYLKKKVRKNTLRLIIDEQLEIKNLTNKIDILKKNENNLKKNYLLLSRNYKFALINNKNLEINKVQLNDEIKKLRINNEAIQDDLNQVNKKKEQLNINALELKSNNQILQNNLDQVNENKDQVNIDIKKLKDDLNVTKLNLNDSLNKNRPYEINNHELKNTISRYIVNTKKIQERLNLAEESKNSKIEEEMAKVKFYQNENIRLSSELLTARKKNETIKENLNYIETEKENISNKIKELNKSIEVKTNIIPSAFVKEPLVQAKNNNDALNEKEQKSLDEVISRIFAKI